MNDPIIFWIVTLIVLMAVLPELMDRINKYFKE